jgi:nucleoside triphosphate diphosphatase
LRNWQTQHPKSAPRRKHDIAPEDALRAANAKFERRFKAMEAIAASRGEKFASLGLDAQEALWQEVKQSEAIVSTQIAD